MVRLLISLFFFFNDPATTEIYTLSLHDALPISLCRRPVSRQPRQFAVHRPVGGDGDQKPPARFRRTHAVRPRSEEHTSELQSPDHLVCRLLLEKKNQYLCVEKRAINKTQTTAVD